MTPDEIAERMGWPAGATYEAIMREACASIAKRLRSLGVVLSDDQAMNGAIMCELVLMVIKARNAPAGFDRSATLARAGKRKAEEEKAEGPASL